MDVGGILTNVTEKEAPMKIVYTVLFPTHARMVKVHVIPNFVGHVPIEFLSFLKGNLGEGEQT